MLLAGNRMAMNEKKVKSKLNVAETAGVTKKGTTLIGYGSSHWANSEV